MPIYTYACGVCSSEIERRQSFSDDPLTVCESCGGSLRRVVHPSGVIFKGSGFYNTDNRKSSGSSSSGGSSENGSEAAASTSSNGDAAKSTGDSSSKASDSNGKASEKAGSSSSPSESATKAT